MTEPVNITVNPDRQELIYLPGDGTAVTFNDASAQCAHLTPIQGAVLVARLRAWADLVERDHDRN